MNKKQETNSSVTGSYSPTLGSYLRGQLLVFDGEYRTKEIDILFGIHPKSKAVESLKYEKLLPDGQPYVPDPSMNQTDPVNLIERLTLKNALIALQEKNTL